MLTLCPSTPWPISADSFHSHSKIGEEVSLSCWGSSAKPVVTMISCVMTGRVPLLFDNTVFGAGIDTEGGMVVNTGALSVGEDCLVGHLRMLALLAANLCCGCCTTLCLRYADLLGKRSPQKTQVWGIGQAL